MSYGSAYIQSTDAPSNRVVVRGNRPRRGHDGRLVHYEKQFDVNLSRLDNRGAKSSIRDSMLAYSEKMRSLTEARGQNDPLFVRAKHIPKYPTRPPKKRRPMSFDELLGRDREKREKENRPQAAKPRPHSDKRKPERDSGARSGEDVHLPALPRTLRHSEPKVRVSLVSASDLYDFVDFSIRSKGTRQDSIRILQMEREAMGRTKTSSTQTKSDDPFAIDDGYDKYERTTDPSQNLDDDSLTTMPMKISVTSPKGHLSLKDNPDIKLPKINPDFFRYRPSRVKRMKLQNSSLGDIPEDKMITPVTPKADKDERKMVTSPPPPTMSPRTTASKSSLTAIQEDEQELITRSAPYRSILPLIDDKRTRRILMRDDGDVRIEVTQCPPKQEPVNVKLKAQKRFRKLIFLRDLR